MEPEVEPRKCNRCSRLARIGRSLCIVCATSKKKSQIRARMLGDPADSVWFTDSRLARKCQSCGASKPQGEPCALCE